MSTENNSRQERLKRPIKESDWNQYRIVSTTQGVDAIIEHTLVNNPDFSDLATLTKQIEKETLKFIEDVESFLLTHY